MTKDEALEMAYQALIRTDRISGYPNNAETIFAIKEALAQPEQEPVAWCISYDGKTPYSLWDEGDGQLLDLKVKEQGGKTCKLPLYTTPPQRTWVELTPEEIEELMDTYDVASADYARAIEAKLKEKNT